MKEHVFIITVNTWTWYKVDGNDITDIKTTIVHLADSHKAAETYIQEHLTETFGWFEIVPATVGGNIYSELCTFYNMGGKKVETSRLTELYDQTKANFLKEKETRMRKRDVPIVDARLA